MQIIKKIILSRQPKKLSLGLLALLTMSIVAASFANALESLTLPDFSATEVSNIGGREVSSKIYRSGVNFRFDQSSEIATIYLNASHTMYRLMFRGTQCIETPSIPQRALGSPLQLLSGVKVTRQFNGTAVVEGHRCKVEKVEVTAADGKTTRFKLWEATDLKGVPLKIEMQTERGQLTTTYRDIVLGTPDATLFTPPTNCIPFDKTYTVAPMNK